MFDKGFAIVPISQFSSFSFVLIIASLLPLPAGLEGGLLVGEPHVFSTGDKGRGEVAAGCVAKGLGEPATRSPQSFVFISVPLSIETFLRFLVGSFFLLG